MASIENRSRYVVSVQNRDALTKTFAFNREAALKQYIADLKAQGFKPKLSRTNDAYVVRIREAGKPKQTLTASSEQEAIDIKQRVEVERRTGLFVDYAKGRRVTFADLLARYLREESPRHKGFEVEGYIINAMLSDAGLPRVDLAEAMMAHKNPHPCHAGKNFSRRKGKSVRLPAPTTCFIRKPFADVVPEDINDYIDDRCQAVGQDTVDREVDLFSAVCNIAIDTWRIPVAKSPMDGVRRPRYFNERDRRLKGNEEERLLDAAFDEDADKSIEARLKELMAEERALPGSQLSVRTQEHRQGSTASPPARGEEQLQAHPLDGSLHPVPTDDGRAPQRDHVHHLEGRRPVRCGGGRCAGSSARGGAKQPRSPGRSRGQIAR